MKPIFIILLFSTCSLQCFGKVPGALFKRLVGEGSIPEFNSLIHKRTLDTMPPVSDDTQSVPLIPNHWYSIKRKNKILKERLTFLVVDDENLLFKANGDTSSILTIPKSEVESIRLGRAPRRLRDIPGMMGSMISLLPEVNSIKRAFFYPYIRLFSKDSVSVVGGPFSSSKQAEKMGNNIIDFDKRMKFLGLVPPKKTRIILNDKPILPSLEGPTAIRPLPSFWNPNVKSTIFLDPVFYNTKLSYDPSVLLHERVHNIFSNMFTRENRLNSQKIIQEALADFLSGYHLNKPDIGTGAFKGASSVRNIESREFTEVSPFSKPVPRRLHTVEDLKGTDDHQRSLFISNFLWRMSHTMTEEKFHSSFVPFIKNISQLEYVERPKPLATKSKEEASIQSTILNLEFFFATALKTFSEGSVENKEIVDLIDVYSSEIGMDLNRIKATKDLLSYNPVVEKKSSRRNQIETTFFITASGGILAIEGYLVYTVLDAILFENNNDIEFEKY